MFGFLEETIEETQRRNYCGGVLCPWTIFLENSLLVCSVGRIECLLWNVISRGYKLGVCVQYECTPKNAWCTPSI
jgi:hypothetical protein